MSIVTVFFMILHVDDNDENSIFQCSGSAVGHSQGQNFHCQSVGPANGHVRLVNEIKLNLVLDTYSPNVAGRISFWLLSLQQCSYFQRKLKFNVIVRLKNSSEFDATNFLHNIKRRNSKTLNFYLLLCSCSECLNV